MAAKEVKEKVSDRKRGLGHISKRLNPPPAKPIMQMKRADGTITTNPKEIDCLVRRKWSKIYDGNKRDRIKAAKEFIRKYEKYIIKLPEQEIDDITWREVKKACRECAHTAAGPDAWEPAEMALLSDEAYKGLATLMNMIEHGAPWPDGMLAARAAFLQKDPEKCGDPMDYRVLRILSAFDRRWASVRLEALKEVGWVSRWTDQSIGAGAEAAGATDASYRISLATEMAKMAGIDLCGGTIDIQKFSPNPGAQRLRSS